MSDKTAHFGLDLGGTNIKGVVLDDAGEIVAQCTRPTGDYHRAESWQGNVQKLLEMLKQESQREVATIGVSSPGLANQENIQINFMPGRFEGLEGMDWRALLGEERVKVLNDAHAALFAESRLGAGKGYKHLVMLTLGTGVGGAVMIDGKLHQGMLQRAGHLGHIPVENLTALDIVNTPGSLEMAVGNATVAQRSHGRFPSTYALVEAYQAGDTWATYVWLDSIKKLAAALVGLANAFSPEAFLIGGGIATAKDSLFKPLADFLELYEWRPEGFQTPILPVHFQEFAGAVGAAQFAAEGFD